MTSHRSRCGTSRDVLGMIRNTAFVGRMKWGHATAAAEHVLRVLAVGRPPQLCRMAGANAARDQK